MYLQIELQVNGTISFFVYHLYFLHSIKIIDRSKQIFFLYHYFLLPKNGIQCGQYPQNNDRAESKAWRNFEHGSINFNNMCIIFFFRIDKTHRNHYHNNSYKRNHHPV